MLVHSVYFTLTDRSVAGRDALIEACRTYLTGHPGTVFFSCGAREPELARPVNDLNFDVALTVGFESRAAHDIYQDHPRHLQFVAENKARWSQARVFDAIDESVS